MISLRHKAGNAQVGLSYFFLIGFFAVVIMEGLGLLKISMVNQLIPIVMLVMTFWFQRQRTTETVGDGDPPRGVPSLNPIQPVTPAPKVNQ